VIYVNDTKVDNILKLVEAVIEKRRKSNKESFKKKRFCHTLIKIKMKINISIILLSRIVTGHVSYYLVLISN
jgi:hypothetical protein